MNLHALRMFHEVIVCGSVTRAAERLHLSQPAVTGQLRNLERELGLSLLRPQGRGIAPTSAGQRLAVRAAILFALEDDIEREAAQLRDGSAGSLRIAATSLPANMLIPPWIASWKRLNPDVEVTLMTSNAQDAFQRVLLYEADLAIVGGGRTPPIGLDSTPLLHDEIGFVVERGHPFAGKTVPLTDILREPFVMREIGSASRDLLAELCGSNDLLLPPVALKCSGAAETLKAVAAGCGVTLASALESHDGIVQGVLAQIEIAESRMANPIALHLRTTESTPPVARLFADHVIASLAAGDGTGGLRPQGGTPSPRPRRR